MQLAPASQKDPNIHGKTQTLHTVNQILTTIFIYIFKCCAYTRIRIHYVSLTKHIYIGTYLYGTKTDPD